MQWPIMLLIEVTGSSRSPKTSRITFASTRSLAAVAGAVRVDVVDLVGRDAAGLEREAHRLDAPVARPGAAA